MSRLDQEVSSSFNALWRASKAEISDAKAGFPVRPDYHANDRYMGALILQARSQGDAREELRLVAFLQDMRHQRRADFMSKARLESESRPRVDRVDLINQFIRMTNPRI